MPTAYRNNQGKFAAWDTGPCYCDTCRALFREDSGHDIPETENWENPVWRQYNEWRYQRIARWVKRMHAAIHEVRHDAVFIAAVQLMESLDTIRPGGWDIDYWVPYQDVLTFECQRRNTAPWWPGIQAKYLASLAPDKPRWMTTSYFYPWWRLYASPEAENRPWIAQQFANGVNTWLHINGGYSDLFDRRGLAPMREVLRRLERWEHYFDGARSVARVALIFSRHTQDNYGGGKPHARYLDFVRGWYQMELLFYRYGFPDPGRVLANAVRWALAEEPTVEVAAPDFVEVTLMAQPQRMLLHLVNLPVGKPVNTGWRHIGRNLVTVNDIVVRLRLAPGTRVREARLATGETTVPVREKDGSIEVTVPRLVDHEIVILEIA
ncbi:MAG: hypothetical protein K2Y16_02620 [Burkholderiales bacterium]|nr:hypothetical protein [Burkholderiales bacterium]